MAFPWTPLGLPGPADAHTVRRAYAARLKHLRVDTDPAGFMQLRAAYEAALARAGPASPVEPGAVPAPEEPPREPVRVTATAPVFASRPPAIAEPPRALPAAPAAPPFAAERLAVARLERRLGHAFRVATRRHQDAERRAAETWADLALARSPRARPAEHAGGLAPPPGASLAFVETAERRLARQLADWHWPEPEPQPASTPADPPDPAPGPAAARATPPPEFVLAAASAFGWDAPGGARRGRGDALLPPATLARARAAAESRARWPAWLAGQGIGLPVADTGAPVTFDPRLRPAMRRAWTWLDAPAPPGALGRLLAYGNPPLEAVALLLDNADALAPGFWTRRGRPATVAFWRRRVAAHRGLDAFGIVATMAAALGGWSLLMLWLVRPAGPLGELVRPAATGQALLAGVGLGLLTGFGLLHPVARLLWWLRRRWTARLAWLARREGQHWLLAHRGPRVAGGLLLCAVAGLPNAGAPLWLVATGLGLGLGSLGLLGFTHRRRPASLLALGFGGLGVAAVVNDAVVRLLGGGPWHALGLGLLVSAAALLAAVQGVRRLARPGSGRLRAWLVVAVGALWFLPLPALLRAATGIAHVEPATVGSQVREAPGAPRVAG